MFSNYLVVALRNLRKHTLFSAINIAGLAIGISASLVIYLLVHYDLSFDKFHKDRPQIYRVVSDLQFPGQQLFSGGVCAPLADAMRNEVTGLEATAPLFVFDNNVKVSFPEAKGDNPPVYKDQKHLSFTDGNFFRIFSYEWIAGSPQTSFAEPFKVVLTKSRAQLYFPGMDAANTIGQTIYYNDSIKVSVSGVVNDFEENTDITFREFISLSTLTTAGLKNVMGLEGWTSVNSNSQLFVKLKMGTPTAAIEKQLVTLRQKYSKNEFMKTTNMLQPLSELHFKNKYDSFNDRQADRTTLYGLLALAGFLLLLGCINFINLTTAQATARAKEIGIRKTMGSSRFNLVLQFLGETFILTTLATILSLLLVPLLLKMFADFIPPGLTFNLLNQPHIIAFILVLIIVVSVLSGFYPAMVLAKFKPVLVLKNQAGPATAKSRQAWLRKSLTVSQFVIAQFFIIATLLVAKQINYAMNKDMGFRKDAIVNVHIPWNAPNEGHRKVLLNKIRSIPEIEKVTLSGETPAAPGYSTTSFKYTEGAKIIESMVEIKSADSIYYDIYKMQFVAGRSALDGDTADREVVVNESFAKFIGFKNPGDAVGKIVERGSKKLMIAGVLKDYHFKSLHAAIAPIAFSNVSSHHRTLHILLKSNAAASSTWKNAIAKVEQQWKSVYPDYDFKYSFFDEKLPLFYESEQKMSRLLTWATGLAIFISCLGMLGLVIYTTNKRVKEIGVRKVLGASVSQIVSLLSKEFILLVMLAFIIATPLAWWAVSDWLSDFAYRTSMSWWIFAGSGLLMIIGALLTLSFQTIRSAMANPVKSLRTE
jgi:putative ABC transport system permease protein